MRTQSLFIKRMTALSLALLFVIASSVTQVQAAPAPDLTSQQIEAVLEDAFAGLVAFDAQRVVNNFASDAVLEDPVGTPPMVGTQAITTYLESFPTLFNQMKLYSLDIKPRAQEARSSGESVSQPSPDTSSSWKVSATSSSTRKGRFSWRKSSSIWTTSSLSCRSDVWSTDYADSITCVICG